MGGSLILILLAASPARGDTVSLTDGREIEGTVIEETEKLVKLRVSKETGSAVVELDKAQVRSVMRTSSDVKKLLKDASAALGQGHRDDAIRILKAVVDAHPGDALARRELAFSELMDEQLERSRDDYARAAALDGGDVESFVGLGYTSARTGDKDAAIAAYRKASTIAPRHARVWISLAELLLARGAKGDREEAIVSAKHGLEAAPSSVDAALLAAEGLARAQGLGAGDEQKAALALLEKFSKENAKTPGATRAVRRAADLAFGLGDPARAKALLDAAIAACPEVSQEERERLLALEALYAWFAASRPTPELGIDAGSEKLEVETAIRRLDLALEAVPAQGELLLLRARLLVRKGKTSEAHDAAGAARASLPAGAAQEDARLLEEWLVRKDGDLLAEKKARRLAELLPLAFEAHEALARALETSGDLAGAVAAFKKASELAPDAEKKRLSGDADRVEGLRKKREKNKDL